MTLPLFLSVDLPLPQEIQDCKFEITKGEPAKDTDCLCWSDKGLSLLDSEMGELFLDFQSSNYFRKSHRGKNELIAKALALRSGNQVIDATLGLAQDAVFLAQLGAKVIGFERSQVVYALLLDAKRRSGIDVDIRQGDSLQELKSLPDKPAVIYMDPMFPEKKKSALPRKEMRIFKKYVGEDPDALELLQLCRELATERVVVKRPLKSEDLAPGVVHSFRGTTVRYDLYSPSRKGS